MVELLPDHDFHNIWGSILAATEVHSRPFADYWMQQYWENPVKALRMYDQILSLYTIMFRDTFNGILPISFHGHVSDAMCPTTAASMLLRLALVSRSETLDSIHDPPAVSSDDLAAILGWTKAQLDCPKWVVIEGSYGAGYGPLASFSAQVAYKQQAVGTGCQCLSLAGQSRAELKSWLTRAKSQGCIGVIVEIVNNQYAGRVTGPDELAVLSETCMETGLLLAIDETLTAFRCGAPFAYQRSEYSSVCNPDLVFFGKALGTNGIGINFDGSFMEKLRIQSTQKKSQALCDWQACVTQPLSLVVLIDALGILEMANSGDWIGRAKIIGQQLRKIVDRRAQGLGEYKLHQGEQVLGGLESFIFVEKEIAATFFVMGASNAGPWVRWVRWLPRLDLQMTEESTLESILSGKGQSRRRQLSEYLDQEGLTPQWCFFCGNSATSPERPAYPWCRNCCINVCIDEECTMRLVQHTCLDSPKVSPTDAESKDGGITS